LLPNGQFGSRATGGKDAASPRYIYTMLNPVTRTLFPKDDDYVLRFLYEENQKIEPEWYYLIFFELYLILGIAPLFRRFWSMALKELALAGRQTFQILIHAIL